MDEDMNKNDAFAPRASGGTDLAGCRVKRGRHATRGWRAAAVLLLAAGLASCQPPAQPAWRSGAERPVEFTVDGEIIEVGPKCMVMRGQDGILYGLRGPMDGFGVGDRVQARLRAAEFDYCFKGLTVWTVSLKHP